MLTFLFPFLPAQLFWPATLFRGQQPTVAMCDIWRRTFVQFYYVFCLWSLGHNNTYMAQFLKAYWCQIKDYIHLTNISKNLNILIVWVVQRSSVSTTRPRGLCSDMITLSPTNQMVQRRKIQILNVSCVMCNVQPQVNSETT